MWWLETITSTHLPNAPTHTFWIILIWVHILLIRLQCSPLLPGARHQQSLRGIFVNRMDWRTALTWVWHSGSRWVASNDSTNSNEQLLQGLVALGRLRLSRSCTQGLETMIERCVVEVLEKIARHIDQPRDPGAKQVLAFRARWSASVMKTKKMKLKWSMKKTEEDIRRWWLYHTISYYTSIYTIYYMTMMMVMLVISILLFWPERFVRTDHQRLRGKSVANSGNGFGFCKTEGMNSGFVQFKTRAQAELARTKLNGKDRVLSRLSAVTTFSPYACCNHWRSILGCACALTGAVPFSQSGTLKLHRFHNRHETDTDRLNVKEEEEEDVEK